MWVLNIEAYKSLHVGVKRCTYSHWSFWMACYQYQGSLHKHKPWCPSLHTIPRLRAATVVYISGFVGLGMSTASWVVYVSQAVVFVGLGALLILSGLDMFSFHRHISLAKLSPAATAYLQEYPLQQIMQRRLGILALMFWISLFVGASGCLLVPISLPNLAGLALGIAMSFWILMLCVVTVIMILFHWPVQRYQSIGELRPPMIQTQFNTFSIVAGHLPPRLSSTSEE